MRYGCSHKTLLARSTSHGWVAAREAAQAKIADKTTELIIEDQAVAFAEWDDMHLAGARVIYFTALAEVQACMDAKRLAPDTSMSSTDLMQYTKMMHIAMQIERTVHGRDKLKVEHSGEIVTASTEEMLAIRTRLDDRARQRIEAEA